MDKKINCIYCSEPVEVEVVKEGYQAHVECAMMYPYPAEIKEKCRKDPDACSSINLH